MIFLIDMNSPVVILLLILGCAALIAVIALIIYKILHPKLKQDKKIDEDKALQEELNRVLEPIEDEKISKDIQNYQSDEDKKQNKEN